MRPAAMAQCCAVVFIVLAMYAAHARITVLEQRTAILRRAVAATASIAASANGINVEVTPTCAGAIDVPGCKAIWGEDE